MSDPISKGYHFKLTATQWVPQESDEVLQSGRRIGLRAQAFVSHSPAFPQVIFSANGAAMKFDLCWSPNLI